MSKYKHSPANRRGLVTLVLRAPRARAPRGSSPRPSNRTLVEGGIYMPGRAPKSTEIDERCPGASSPPGPAPCLRKTVPICLIFGDKLHFLSSFPIFPAAGLAQISREARENFLILTSLILRKTALLLLKALGFRGLRECAHLSTRACRGPGNPQGARGRPDPCQGPHDGPQARAASPFYATVS